MFPPEVLTFIVTFVLRTVAEKWLSSGEEKARARAMELKMIEQELKAQNSIRAMIDKALFGWTMSILAFIAFGCIIGVRIVGPLFIPDIPIFYAYPEETSGFLFFTSGSEKVKFEQMQGITFLPSDSHILSAIAGCFFGRIRK
jgi:hypothetical protein